MSHRSLSAHALTFRYLGGPAVLDSATLEVRAGRRLALLGANGSGKSTLLSCLAGSLKPTSGAVLLDGAPLTYSRSALRRHRQEVQLVLQDPDDQLFSADVAQDVSFGPMNLGLGADDVRHRVDEALDRLGIEHLRRKPTHQLSFGEKKRVAMAGAIAMRPCILLLDEPTAGLDPLGVEELLSALERLERHSTTVVVATHDVAFALEWADDSAIISGGSVLAGDPAQLLADESALAAARLRRPWALTLAVLLAEENLIDRHVRPRDVRGVFEGVLQWSTPRSPDARNSSPTPGCTRPIS